MFVSPIVGYDLKIDNIPADNVNPKRGFECKKNVRGRTWIKAWVWRTVMKNER